MDWGSGLREKNGTGLDGWRIGMRERRRGRAGLMGEWDEGEKRERGWMDG